MNKKLFSSREELFFLIFVIRMTGSYSIINKVGSNATSNCSTTRSTEPELKVAVF